MADCGITNLGACISEKFYEYTLSIINAPLQPFLGMIKDFLSEPVNITSFISLWSIIIYIISLFYGILIILVGFNFVLSAYSAERRYQAKEWLKNIVLMLFFIQGSYYIYSALLELSAILSSSMLNLIDRTFFLLTVDNIPNIGLQIILAIPYLLVLLFTVIWLALRYLLVSIGLVFFPLGLFFYFIPPMRSTGRLINNTLMVVIFIPIVQALILLAASKLVSISLFQNVKIIIMIASFLLINFSFAYLINHALSKSSAITNIKANLSKLADKG